MTDTTSGSGAPSGTSGNAPGGDAASNTGGSFVRTRTSQMAETMQQQPQGAQAEPDAGRQQQQSQQQPTGEKVYRDWTAAEIDAAFTFKSEQDVRKSGLPSSPEAFEAKLSPSFQPPVNGVTFEFDANSPALANVRKVALKHALSQEAFSDLLDVYAAEKIGEQAGTVRAREANLQQLGAAGPQRISAISTWLKSIAGKDGADVATFIQNYPAAPIVRAMETVIRRFSSQGGADFSQSHRDQAEDQGKIAGYENMSFVQRRIAQMSQTLNRPRGDGRRG